MLTIENIYNSRTLERHSELIYINNQPIVGIKPLNSEGDYYIVATPFEIVIARKHKKLKIPMIPFKNDSKWS